MPPQRPGSVTFVAIVNIIIGAFGILGIISFVFSLVLIASGGLKLTGGQPNPGIELHNYLIREVPSYTNWMSFGAFLLIFATTLAFLSGLGLLKLQPRARALTIGYAIYLILQQVVTVTYNLVYVMPAASHWETEFLRQNPKLPPFVAQSTTIGMYVGLAVPLLYVIWALIMLGIMNSGNVKLAFSGRPLSPEEEYDRRAGI